MIFVRTWHTFTAAISFLPDYCETYHFASSPCRSRAILYYCWIVIVSEERSDQYYTSRIHVTNTLTKSAVIKNFREKSGRLFFYAEIATRESDIMMYQEGIRKYDTDKNARSNFWFPLLATLYSRNATGKRERMALGHAQSRRTKEAESIARQIFL